jgi:hypothetical protein
MDNLLTATFSTRSDDGDPFLAAVNQRGWRVNRNCDDPTCANYDGDTIEVEGICCHPKSAKGVLDEMFNSMSRDNSILDLSRELAKEHGYDEIFHDPQSRVVSFRSPPPTDVRVIVYYTTRTVGTRLLHPRVGMVAQVFRRNVSDEDLRIIFHDPRTHLGYRYQKKPRVGESCGGGKVDCDEAAVVDDEKIELGRHLAFLDSAIENALGGEVIILKEEREEILESLQSLSSSEESARLREGQKEKQRAKDKLKLKLRELRGVNVAWTANLQPFVYDNFASTVISIALGDNLVIAMVYDNGTLSWDGGEMPTDLSNLLYLSRSTLERKRRYHPTYISMGSGGRFYCKFDDGSERYNTNSEMLDDIISNNDVSKCAFGRPGEMAVVLTDGRLLWNFSAPPAFQSAVDVTYEEGGTFIDVALSPNGFGWFLRGQVGGRETHCFDSTSSAGRAAGLLAQNRKQIKCIYFGDDDETFILRFKDLE